MALKFDIVGDNGNFLKSLDESVNGVRRAQKEIEQSGMGIEDMFKRIAAAAGIAFSLEGAKSFLSKVVEMRSYFQDIESSMEVFLGSAEKGQKFMEDLKAAAYYNMFEFTDLANASKQLIAYKNDVDTVIPTIQKLSDVAVGTSAPLLDLVNLYNKAKSTGKVSSQDLYSWAVKGVVLKDVLKEMGEEATDTSVSFEQLNKVLDHVTSEGGMFYQLQDKMMSNISAEIGQFQDNLALMLNEIGEKYQDEITGVIKIGSELIDNYQTIAGWIKDLIIAYGTYRAALAVCLAVDKAIVYWKGLQAEATMMNTLANAGETTSVTALTVAKLRLTAATKALTTAIMANPYVLVAAGVATLTYAVYKLATAETEAEKAQAQLNEAYANTNSEIQTERAEIDRLFKQLRNAKEGTDDYKKAKDQILAQYGQYLKGLDNEIATLKDVEGAYKAVAKAAREASIARGKEAALKDVQETYGAKYSDYASKLQTALKSVADDKTVTEIMGRVNAELNDFGNITTQLEGRIKKLFEPKKGGGLFDANVYRPKVGQYLQALRNNEKYLRDYSDIVEQRFHIDEEEGRHEEQKQVRNKQAIEDEKKKLQAQLDNLSKEEAIGKKGIELKKKINALDRELQAYNAGGRNAGNDAAARRQREYELGRKLTEEEAAQLQATRNAVEQARIAAIQNDGEREREAQAEQHRLNLQAIDDREEEMKKALYAYNKSVWENKNTNKSLKYSDTTEGAAGLENLELTKEQIEELSALRKRENEEYARLIRERYKEEARQMREYLKSYGSFEQRKLAITEEYEQKIKDANSEGERRLLRKEQKQAEARMQFESISMDIDWKALFSGVGNLNRQMMQPIMDQLKAYVQTDQYRNADADTQQRVADLIAELRTYLGSDHEVTWQTLDTAMNNFMGAVDKYNEAVEKEKEAVDKLGEAKRRLDRGEITEEEYNRLKEEASKLGDETANAKESMSNFAQSLNNVTDEVENYTSRLTTFLSGLKGLNGLEGGGELKVAISNLDELKGNIDATLAGMKSGVMKDIGEGVSNAISAGMNFLGNGLTSILGEGIGSMITLIAQLPKMILQIVATIKNLVTGVLNAITELISLRWIDDLINSILDAIGNVIDAVLDLPENIAKVLGSVLEGVGGLVEGVVGRVANIVTFGALDSGFLSDWLFGDNSAYEAAIDKWGWLLDTWEDNLEYEKNLMEKAYGENAIDIQQYTEGMLKNTMQAAREVYEGWAGSGAGLFSHSNGYEANRDARWDYLIKSNPEIAKKLGINMVNTPWFSFYEGEDISKLFDLDWKELDKLKHENTQFWQSLYEEARNYLDQYIEAGKAIEEIQNTLNERLTTTTKENVFDDFLKSLYDLADGSEDVFDNIADAWQKMVNKMVINNLVGKQFQQSLEQWYEKLAEMQRQRTEGNMDDEWYKAQLEALKNEYKGYVEDAQSQIENLRNMGIINASASNNSEYSQEASKKGFATMSQDTAEELNGRFTALQIAGETISSQTIAINAQLVVMTELMGGNGTYLSEIRNMMIQGNSFLEDIAKYSKRIYIDFQERLESLVNNTKNM